MRPFRVLSYNVRYFGHATRGIASTQSAMKRIATALAALDPLPDVICLQEVETDSLRSTVAHRKRHPDETQLERWMTTFDGELLAAGKKERFNAYYFPAHVYALAPKAHIYTTGLAILAGERFQIAHHNATRPEDITHRRVHPVRRLKQTRICAHVRLSHADGEFLDVFNTHLSLPSTFSREFWTQPFRMGYGKNQLEEAKNLLRFIDSQKKSSQVVVVGDFNSLPGSPVYRYFLQEGGLCDPFARLHNMSEEELRAWPTAGFMRLRMHLDHIFTSSALGWLDFEGSHPFGDRNAAFSGLSDHMPLIGRFRLPAFRAPARSAQPVSR